MFLESNCLLDEVEQTIDIGRYTGVSVVPLTVIDNKWSLVGAQSSDVYYQVSRALCSLLLHSIKSFADLPQVVSGEGVMISRDDRKTYAAHATLCHPCHLNHL